MKTLVNQIISILTMLLFVTLTACEQQSERQYYDNGQLKLFVELDKGKRNGKSVEYYKSGKVKIVSYWIEGKRTGKTEVFYESGILKQESYYTDGTLCCQAKLYREDQTLQEIQYFNDKGKLMDFVKFNKNGKQNIDLTTRKAVFVTKADTINFGEYYEAEIRLGNRRFNNIKVISGDLDDEQIIDKQPLPMKDSVTAIFKFRPDKPGKHFIEGVIVEVNDKFPDSLLVVPFLQPYYVIGREVSI